MRKILIRLCALILWFFAFAFLLATINSLTKSDAWGVVIGLILTAGTLGLGWYLWQKPSSKTITAEPRRPHAPLNPPPSALPQPPITEPVTELPYPVETTPPPVELVVAPPKPQTPITPLKEVDRLEEDKLPNPVTTPPDHSARDISQMPIVTVAFKTLDGSDLSPWDTPERGYAYRWPFDEEPHVGDWATAEGYDGPTTVVVLYIGQHPSNDYPPDQLKLLSERLDPEVVREAQDKYARDMAAWFDEARYKTGLRTVSGPVRTPTPQFPHLPDLASPDSDVDAETARERASEWWHVYKEARSLGFPDNEVDAYYRAARGWYALADATEREDYNAHFDRLIHAGVLSQPRSRHEINEGKLGKTDLEAWLPYVIDLDRNGDRDSAIRVVLALISAEEETARANKRSPRFLYTDRAGIIYRKAQRYDDEVTVIEQYLAMIPPPTGYGLDAALYRLRKAKSLQANAVKKDRK